MLDKPFINRNRMGSIFREVYNRHIRVHMRIDEEGLTSILTS